MKVIRAKSAGFCFGVERAIDIATTCTEGGKCRVYTDGPLIHNRQMMERLTNKGILEIGDYKSEGHIDSEIDQGKLRIGFSRPRSVSGTPRIFAQFGIAV